MTDTLLIIITVLLAVRIVLQIRQGKRAFEKMYQATSEVKNVHIMVSKHDIDKYLDIFSKQGYELIHVVNLSEHGMFQLFFTRKKIKNFLEE